MLELRDLACERGGARLFGGVAARLRPGELLFVRGANGAGKTSLLRIICGLSTPADGAVLWRGQPVLRLREEFSRELAYVGHGAALKDDLSACENLAAASALAGRGGDAGAAARSLAAAGLAGRRMGLPARALSHGQRRRAVLAGLALEPAAALWVLDEPFNALDAAAARWLLVLIGAQLARAGMVVLTSHQSVALDPTWPRIEVSL